MGGRRVDGRAVMGAWAALHPGLLSSALTSLLLLLVPSAAPAADRSSFRPGALWPDDRGVHINAHGGGILDFEGRYYWFGEHKVEGEAGNTAQVGVHCYSSSDLYNWKDEGIVLPVVKDDPGHDLTAGSVVERPKVIHNRRTGKFVMWFHLERKGTGYTSARSGVAMADRVTGPYAYRGSFRPNAGAWPRNIRPEQKVKQDAAAAHRYTGGELPAEPDRLNLVARDFEGGQMARDQTLFVDDDGAAYHVYASEENSTLQISRLTDDYLAPAGEYVRVFPGRFMEAPALFKHEGRYWFIGSGCTGWAPNAARSAVADSIWGPWTELGNPAVGAGAERTFESQSTFVLPVRGRPGAFIFMADRWRPENAIDGRYVWLPVLFRSGRIEIEWRDEWDLRVFGPVASSAARGEGVRVETGPDGRSWTIANGLVERRVRFAEGQGLCTTSFRRPATGTEFLDASPGAPGGELSFQADGVDIGGGAAPLAFIGASVRDVDPSGRALEVRLRDPRQALEVTVTWAAYAGHAFTRKWVAVTNRGERPATLTRLVPEQLPLSAGRPSETLVRAFHGVFPREIFTTGRVDDGLVRLSNARTGEGLAVLNEAPGYLKRTDVLGFDWTSGVRCGYDTDLFPFERSLVPGETFTSAACSIGVFAEGDGTADPGYVLPSYLAHVLLRKGASYRPPWIYNTWEPFFREVEEAKTGEAIDVAGRMGFDVFTIDDGWQERHGANDVWKKTFPSGLDPIRARVEKAGMRLGLWYPLAAIDTDTADYREHPEWAARERDGKVKHTGTAAGTKAVMCLATPYRHRAARRLNALIAAHHLAYVKVDLTTVFNTYGEAPGCHAEGHEHRTWAESLTRIYEGIQELTAEVYREHPGVLLDLTFELWGQKHLIDAGLLAAGDLDWLSNVHDGKPDSAGPLQARTLLYHRALAAPVEAMLIGNLRVNTEPVESRFATAIGAGPVLLGDPRALSAAQVAFYRERISWFKELRAEVPIEEGFFPLGGWRQPNVRAWDGFARLSRAGEGLLVLFRNESPETRAAIRWPAPEGASFELRPAGGGQPVARLTGELLRKGVEMDLPAAGQTGVYEVRRAR